MEIRARSIFFVMAVFILSLSIFSCQQGNSAEKGGGDNKVVYHLSELEKVYFVLNNIRNHIKGAKDPSKLDIILVVHGPGLKPFHNDKTTDKIVNGVANLSKKGVKFNACGNTMDAQSVKLDGMVSGFTRRNEGGVVRIAELQSKGYLYIRP